MFKPLLTALLALALLCALVLAVFVTPIPLPRIVGWAMLFAGLLILAWPLLTHYSRKIAAFLGLWFLMFSLSACASIAGGDAKGAQDLFAKILTDPACAHDDKISVVTGAAGIPASVQASAERHCPGPKAVPATEASPPS